MFGGLPAQTQGPIPNLQWCRSSLCWSRLPLVGLDGLVECLSARRTSSCLSVPKKLIRPIYILDQHTKKKYTYTIKYQTICLYDYAYGPKTGPAFLRWFAFGLIRGGGWGGGGRVGLLTSLVFVPHDLCSSLYFVAHTSGYVGYVLFTSLHIRQGTLDTSSLLRCTYFMLRWIRLLYLVAHTSCYQYVGYVFSTSLDNR